MPYNFRAKHASGISMNSLDVFTDCFPRWRNSTCTRLYISFKLAMKDNYGYWNVSATCQACSIHLPMKQMVGSKPPISGLQACSGSVGQISMFGEVFSLVMARYCWHAFQNLQLQLVCSCMHSSLYVAAASITKLAGIQI